MKRILYNLKENWIKYGFETLAVTVGILGAFALEAWKDDRQQEKELVEIYKTISEDLQSDILALDTILEKFEWRIHTMAQILLESPSIDDWINNDSLAISFLGYPDFLENQRGLDLLKSKIAITGETGKLAGQISNFYREKLLKNEATREEFSSFFYDNLKYWTGNGEWLSFFALERDHTLLGQYVQDNSNFRNRISLYLTVFSNHHRYLKMYKEEGAILKDEIDAFLDGKL